MTVHLFDGMNYIRRVFEMDLGGRAPRRIVTDMFSLQNGDVAIWCWEGRGAKSERQKIYPKYKAKRKPQPDDIWPIIGMLQKAFLHTPALQVSVDGYEADDLIATLVRQFAGKERIYIRSYDQDFSALLDLPGVKGDFALKKELKPDEVHLYKTTVGDTSDGVTGIPGFGAKGWENADKAELANVVRYCVQNPDALIDEIPSLSKRINNWLREKESRDYVASMWKVTELLSVPSDKMSKAIKVGEPNFEIADIILKYYLH